MRNGDFEFDGDKTDLMRKGWSNVDQLHSPQIKTYVFRNRVDAMGRAMITRDKVIVATEDGIKTFPRSELLSILKGGARERDWWVFEVGAGFTGAFGNSNQSSLTADFGLGRHDKRTSTVLLYEGTFGAANREVNVNRHLGQVGVTLFVSDRFYVVPAAAAFFHDRFANIKFRATPAALGGVQIFDTNRVEWDFECGLGYQFLRAISTLPNVPNPQSDGFVPLRTYLEFDITDDIELDLGWQSNIVFTTIGNTNHFGEATFTVEVTDIFNLKTEFEYFRTEQPIPEDDGSVPQSNDFQLIVGFLIRVG
jgi:putative salt-induced outer membrane protein YdiY